MSACTAENFDRPGTVHSSAAVAGVQPRQAANRAILIGPCRCTGSIAAGPDDEATSLTKRGLCQSVCSLATFRIRLRKLSCASTCQPSAHPRRSSSRRSRKQVVREASRSSITSIVASPKRPSSDSISSHSKGGRSPSPRRGRVKTRPGGRDRGGFGGPPRPGGFGGPRPGGPMGGPPRPGGFTGPRPVEHRRRAGVAATQLRARRSAQAQAKAA